jgi:hypothetical protein
VIELPKTIKFKNPVIFGDEMVTGLTFAREMTASDCYDMALGTEKYTFRDIAKLIASMAGVPRPLIDRLSMPDFMACVEVANYFFQDSLATGEES